MSVSIYDGQNDRLNQIAGREDTSFWEGTKAQWEALNASEKAAYIGKYVIITDDEEERHHDFTTDGTETILNLWKRVLSWCVTNLNIEDIKNMHILSDYRANTKIGATYQPSGFNKTDANNMSLGISNIGGFEVSNGGTLDTIYIGYKLENGVDHVFQIQTRVGVNVADTASTPTVNTVAVYKESTALMNARTIRVVW